MTSLFLPCVLIVMTLILQVTFSGADDETGPFEQVNNVCAHGDGWNPAATCSSIIVIRDANDVVTSFNLSYTCYDLYGARVLQGEIDPNDFLTYDTQMMQRRSNRLVCRQPGQSGFRDRCDPNTMEIQYLPSAGRRRPSYNFTVTCFGGFGGATLIPGQYINLEGCVQNLGGSLLPC